jgi:hypothetical protein
MMRLYRNYVSRLSTAEYSVLIALLTFAIATAIWLAEGERAGAAVKTGIFIGMGCGAASALFGRNRRRRFNDYWLGRPAWQFAAVTSLQGVLLALAITLIGGLPLDAALGTAIGLGIAVFVGCMIGRWAYRRR